jgi:hypothetical protein
VSLAPINDACAGAILLHTFTLVLNFGNENLTEPFLEKLAVSEIGRLMID